MSRFQKLFKRNQLAIISGFLVGTSYIPLPPWALAFCWIPLWLQLARPNENLKSAFVGGWISQFLLSLIGFHWIAYVSREFGFMPWPVAILVLLLFAAFIHLYVPIAAVLALKLREKFALKPLSFFVTLACLHTLGEIFWPSLFPWNLGYPLFAAGLSAAQWADIVGFQGLSFGVHLINAFLAWALFVPSRRQQVVTFISLLFICLLLSFGGYYRGLEWSPTNKILRVLQVQANIGNFEKYYAEKGVGYQQSIVDQYFNLTRQGVERFPDADLIIWPESAYPDYLNPQLLYRSYSQQLVNFIRSIKKPLLTGAYSREEGPPGTKPRDYNGLFLLNEHGLPNQAPYHKTYLLVFGEYTPFSEYFPFLAKISPAGEGFKRGMGPQVIPFNEVKIGVQICYESLYPDFSAKLSQMGSDVFVNLTNDSWFGPTFEPYQHMYMTLARAVEMRRPLIRSTNTGFTTAALADGTILQKSELQKPWFGLFEIEYKDKSPQTFYAQFGSWLPYLILIILGLLLIWSKIGTRSQTP